MTDYVLFTPFSLWVCVSGTLSLKFIQGKETGKGKLKDMSNFCKDKNLNYTMKQWEKVAWSCGKP